MRSLPSVSAAFCILILASCGEQNAEPEGGDLDPSWKVLSAVDSTLIDEGDDAYIGEPFNILLVRDSAGPGQDEIWISDSFSKSLLHFDGDGAFVKRVGSPGPGPAEFSLPRFAFRTEDGQVVVDDFRQSSLKWFDAETGELNTTLRYDTGMIGISIPLTSRFRSGRRSGPSSQSRTTTSTLWIAGCRIPTPKAGSSASSSPPQKTARLSI